jgi:hypothetical protein
MSSERRLDHSFGQVSGLSLDAFHAIGVRSLQNARMDWRTAESHVYEVDGKAAYVGLATPGLFASIWRSEKGELHIAHQDGALFTKNSDGTYARCAIRASLLGVWGLDGDHVYAWGLDGSTPVMLRYAGRGSWVPMPSPTEMVFAMSGDRPDRLVAVGMKGMISIWDGASWSNRPSPVTGALRSIHWVSEDEIYACGTGSPYVLEGSIYGWTRHGPFPQSLYCVAKHSGSIWVGCGMAGLRRLEPGQDELAPVKASIHAQDFDPRKDLLVSAPDMIAATRDGESFEAVSVDGYAELAASTPPSFDH